MNITGNTKIGLNNKIFHSSSLGAAPQDMKYANEPTSLIIGDNNTIREFCTFNTGTIQDQGVTKVGNSNWFMAYVHIAHDCVVGNNVVFANNATLAGHVTVGNWAIFGGFTGAHQFTKIGAHSFIGMNTLTTKDIPAYVMAEGQPIKPRGVNVEGLKRRGFSASSISSIKRAFKVVYRDSQGRLLDQALKELEASESDSAEVMQFVECIRNSRVGIMRGPVDE